MRTVEVLRGQVPSTFTVFRTGSPTFVVDGDPPYVVGGRYMLFLRSYDAETLIPVSPDGRLREEAGGRFDAVLEGGPGGLISDKTKSQLKDMIEGIQ